MLDYLQVMIISDSFFWFCALTGIGMLIIQSLLNLIGFDEVLEGDSVEPSDQPGKVAWISKQGLSIFLIVFGWSAIGYQRQFGITGTSKWLLAIMTGLFAVFSTRFIFRLVTKLQHTTTVFNIDDVIGKEAIVYQQILFGGVGKVSVSINDFSCEIDAISFNEELPSHTRVLIVQKADNKTVYVKTL